MIDVDDIDHYGCASDFEGTMTSFEKDIEVTLGDTEVTVTVHLECTSPSEEPRGQFGPPELYDPGGPAEFDLEWAEVSLGSDTAKLTANLFWALLGDKAQLIYDAAIEAAQESGEF